MATIISPERASRVALKIAHSGTHFSTMGRVVNCVGDQTSRGLGIEFTEVDAGDKVRLEACLTELAATTTYHLSPIRICTSLWCVPELLNGHIGDSDDDGHNLASEFHAYSAEGASQYRTGADST